MLLGFNKYKSIIYFIKKIKIDIISIILFSIITGILSNSKALQDLAIPIALVGIIGTAISLLLAFRTAQAYDRWWEARTVWGAIVNDSRTLIRQVQLFLPTDQHEQVKAFAERQYTWCFSLANSLRKLPFDKQTAAYIERNNIVDSNVPNAILSLHTKQIKDLVTQGYISEFREVQLDTTISKLCDAMGRCERIKNTIFPVSYEKLVHLIIYFFALILPFSLDPDHALIKAILMFFVPLLFIVIDRTAILLQSPFENEPMDTPMSTLSRTIEMNLLQMIGEKAEMPKGPHEDYHFIL